MLTGTVLSGSVSVGDVRSLDCLNVTVSHQGLLMSLLIRAGVLRPQTIELPVLKVQRKVKSLQMFRQPVQRARQVSNWVV